MKIAVLVSVVLALTACFSAVDGQRGGRRFGGGRRGGIGFGRRRFGGLGGLGGIGLFGGLGGLGGIGGLGGLGMPLMMPMPVPMMGVPPVPPPMPMGMPGMGMPGMGMPGMGMPGMGMPGMGMPGMMGKRESEEIPVFNSTETICELKNSKLNCQGSQHNFECDVEQKLNEEHLEKEFKDLRILPINFERENNTLIERTMLLSIQPELNLFNNYTMSHEHKNMLLSIFHNETIEDEGFRVKDLDCWKKFDEMITHDKQVELTMKLAF